MRLNTVRSLQVVLTIAALLLTAFEGRAEKGNLKIVEFADAPLEEVIEYFRSGPGAGGKTRNILVDPKVDLDVKVTMKLSDVSAGVAFAYAAELAGFDYREDRHALRIMPLKGKTPAVRGFLQRGSPMTSRRASEIVMPKADFDETELSVVINDIASASKQLDPKKKGLNIILGHGVDPTTPVTLRLQDVPVSTVLKYVADTAKLTLRADGPAIVLMTRPKVGE